MSINDEALHINMEATDQQPPQQPPFLGVKRRSNKRKHNDDDEVNDIHQQIKTFQNSSHSLRISASSVAALCGLHPYQNLPQLFFDLIYQSYLGQLLLQNDAALLGLTLVDAQAHERQQMLNMASTISQETTNLVQTAINISDGKTKIQSVDEIQTIQQQIKLNAVASGKLSKRQVETLVEASRGKMSTGFGNIHEDDALNLYERKVGCCVRERNESLMTWKFERVVVGNTTASATATATRDCSDSIVTAKPLEKATRREWGQMMTNAEEEVEEATNNGGKDEQRRKDDCNVDDVIVIDDNDHGSTPSSEEQQPQQQQLQKPHYFFKIVGAVDGIRDEIYIDNASSKPDSDPNTTYDESSTMNNVDEYDDVNERWTVRPIIVECKHRITKAKIPPPLYDMIQTCLYCHMYNVDDADLIQVVRRKDKGDGSSCDESAEDRGKGTQIANTGDDEGKENDQPTIDDDMETREVAKKNSNCGESEEDCSNVQITISRISLNDTIHNHRHHWNETLLPRLASFVDAVYKVRKDDGKRYRLLMAFGTNCDDESNEEEAWRILHEELPWLINCDTIFRRGKRNYS